MKFNFKNKVVDLSDPYYKTSSLVFRVFIFNFICFIFVTLLFSSLISFVSSIEYQNNIQDFLNMGVDLSIDNFSYTSLDSISYDLSSSLIKIPRKMYVFFCFALVFWLFWVEHLLYLFHRYIDLKRGDTRK